MTYLCIINVFLVISLTRKKNLESYERVQRLKNKKHKTTGGLYVLHGIGKSCVDFWLIYLGTFGGNG